MAIKIGDKFDNFTVVRTKSEYNKVLGHNGRIARFVRRAKWHTDSKAHKRYEDMSKAVAEGNNDVYYALL